MIFLWMSCASVVQVIRQNAIHQAVWYISGKVSDPIMASDLDTAARSHKVILKYLFQFFYGSVPSATLMQLETAAVQSAGLQNLIKITSSAA
jgi:hypothetical protein